MKLCPVCNSQLPDNQEVPEFVPLGYHEDALALSIKRRIAAEEKLRWIPVSERLPDDSELVMLFAPAGTYTDFDWYDFGIYHKGSNSFLHIGFPLCAQFLPTSTHWMPLPSPPDEVE